MQSEEIDYAGVLSRLVGLQEKTLIVSIRGAGDDPPLFLFFDSLLIRGWEGNMGGHLGHDPESVELDFGLRGAYRRALFLVHRFVSSVGVSALKLGLERQNWLAKLEDFRP